MKKIFSVHVPLCVGTFMSFALHASAAQVVESDICIYGGTSGGVAAAVQAARMGKSAVVVEPGAHLGGMTSGGLGLTDTGNSGTIGGVSREFYRRVGQYYGRTESFTFEPHVAEAVFKSMLQEANVPVHYRQRLASVAMEGKRITGITTENGIQFRAKMFLDTTYEGDLLAAAGVSFAVGRESTNTYNESLNGIRPNTPSHQFALAVDPYIIAGDANSGLLPFIQSGDGGSPGSGDHRVQAYNFRLCLTQVATNRLAINPPPNYDAGQYELLGRYIQARISAGHALTLGSFLKIDSMPNGKTDINNNGAFSTDYIGMNYTYTTNTYAQRDAIWLDHEYYIRGFLTFLATDSRVPAAVRTNMQSWGLCWDEFQDTGGWPHQLYVREARRMISDYVMIQANCEGTRVASDSVGLASYNMDSHNCQRFVRSGAVTNEGDVQLAPAAPFPISYRSIVPKSGECENLFATFCLSGSHIAFSSCRMEPVFMITSQSAATAAAFAIDENVPVQNVPYARLRLQMLADGQVLQWGSSLTTSNAIVLDTEQATNAVTLTGSWSSSSANPGYNGINYLHDANTGKGAKSVRFTPNIPVTGRYTVSMKWPQNANRATNIPIIISHASGSTNLTLNQRVTGNIWITLGTFNFDAGTNGNLFLQTTGTDGYVIADAVMWQGIAEAPLPEVELLASDTLAVENTSDSALFIIVRSGNIDAPLTIAYTLTGTAAIAEDYPPLPGSLVFPPGQALAKVAIVPLMDWLIEGDETVTLTLNADPSIKLGTYRSATVHLRDGPVTTWSTNYFSVAELTDTRISGPLSDPDQDGINNLMEFFLDTNPRTRTTAPGMQLTHEAEGWHLDWQRSSAAAGLNLRLETSTDLIHWLPAPFQSQSPQVTSQVSTQHLRFNLGNPVTNAPSTFYRIAVGTAAMPLVTNDAFFFFSFDTGVEGANLFQPGVTANHGFPGTPTLNRTGSILADAGGAASFTDFMGTTWLGSGGSSTPGHSATFNNGSQNNMMSLSFSTLGLGQIRLRMDIRSAAQAGGVAPAEFTGFYYDIGGGPQPVPGVDINVVADNTYHEWVADLSGLPELNNLPNLTLIWTVKNLVGTPAESFRVDNIQVTAMPNWQ